MLFVPVESRAQGLQIEGQNRIRLFGSWTITVIGATDNFDLLVQTASGQRLIQYDEDDFDDGLIVPETIDNNDPGGWTIDVFDDHDDDGAPPGFLESTMIRETYLSDSR